MAEQNIELIKLTDPRVPLLEVISDTALLYIVQDNISYKTQFGYLRRLLAQDGEALPDANEGDGLIYEGGSWINRRLTNEDIDGLRIKTNISVTTQFDGNNLLLNPASETQQYMLNNIVYDLPSTVTIPIDPLTDPSLSRIDVVVLRANGNAALIQGVESQSPLEPAIGENDVYIGSVTRQGEGLSIDTLDDFFDNGIQRVGDLIGLGGPLTRNTTITSSGFNFTLTSNSDIQLSTTGRNTISGGFGTLILDTDVTIATPNEGIKYSSSKLYADMVGTSLLSKEANEERLNVLLGHGEGAANMGAYTPIILTDNAPVKTSITEIATLLTTGSAGDMIYYDGAAYSATSYIQVDPTAATMEMNAVSVVPVTPVVNKTLWYSDDYYSNPNTASPYVLTEDGVLINIRDTIFNDIDFFQEAEIDSADVYGFRGIIQFFEGFVGNNVVSSVSWEIALDPALGSATTWIPQATLTDVNAYILANITGNRYNGDRFYIRPIITYGGATIDKNKLAIVSTAFRYV